MKDYYKILGVARKASDDDIKKAYRKLAMLHHPDRNQGDGSRAAEEKFKEAKEAYEFLSEPLKRRELDASFERPKFQETKPFQPADFGTQTFYKRQPPQPQQTELEADAYGVDYVVRPSLTEAYRGFTCRVKLPTGLIKRVRVPAGVPNGLVFDVDGYKVTVAFIHNVFQTVPMSKASRVIQLIDNKPTVHLKTGILFYNHQLEFNTGSAYSPRGYAQSSLPKFADVPDFLGGTVKVEVPHGLSSDTVSMPIEVPNRGYLDWLPDSSTATSKRASMFVRFVVPTYTPFKSFA